MTGRLSGEKRDGWEREVKGGHREHVGEEGQGGKMKMERGETRLERGPRAEDGQTGRTERDWSMDDGRGDDILDSDQLYFVGKQPPGNEIFHS